VSYETHKEIVRKHYRALSSGDLKLFRSLITDDYVVIVTGQSKVAATMNQDQIVEFVEAATTTTRGGFTFQILSMTAEDDRVASEADGRATLKNGAEFVNHYVHLFRFRDGKICEVKEFSDTAIAERAFFDIEL